MLRLACRAHRLMNGFLRIGIDPLHQILHSKLASLQAAQPRFRKIAHLIDLIHHGLLDGAIVSWVPTSENKGEGLFLEFDPATIEDWCASDPVRERCSQFIAAFENDWLESRGLTTTDFPFLVPLTCFSTASATS